jgi:hypothetical protein
MRCSCMRLDRKNIIFGCSCSKLSVDHIRHRQMRRRSAKKGSQEFPDARPRDKTHEAGVLFPEPERSLEFGCATVTHTRRSHPRPWRCCGSLDCATFTHSQRAAQADQTESRQRPGRSLRPSRKRLRQQRPCRHPRSSASGRAVDGEDQITTPRSCLPRISMPAFLSSPANF